MTANDWGPWSEPRQSLPDLFLFLAEASRLFNKDSFPSRRP